MAVTGSAGKAGCAHSGSSASVRTTCSSSARARGAVSGCTAIATPPRDISLDQSRGGPGSTIPYPPRLAQARGRSISCVELPGGDGALQVARVGVAVERGDGARQVADLRRDVHDGAHAGDVQLAVARQRLRALHVHLVGLARELVVGVQLVRQDADRLFLACWIVQP